MFTRPPHSCDAQEPLYVYGALTIASTGLGVSSTLSPPRPVVIMIDLFLTTDAPSWYLAPPSQPKQYLIGPSLGSSIWSLFHRSKLPELNRKDAAFYEHIKRRRVDPSRTNMQNPIPDFYGEKICELSSMSIAAYELSCCCLFR